MSLRSAFFDVPGERDELVTHIAHAAATATEHIAVWQSPCRAKLKGVDWVPIGVVTGTNTNYTNLNVQNRGTDGNSTTELANMDFVGGTNAPDLTATAIYSPAAGSELQMSQGTCIAVEAEKVNTGLALPAGTFVFTYEPN